MQTTNLTCPQCAATVQSADRFCRNCGAAAVMPPVDTAGYAAAIASPAAAVPAPARIARGRSTALVVTGVISLIIAALGAAEPLGTLIIAPPVMGIVVKPVVRTTPSARPYVLVILAALALGLLAGFSRVMG